jgi:hypothetical protein
MGERTGVAGARTAQRVAGRWLRGGAAGAVALLVVSTTLVSGAAADVDAAPADRADRVGQVAVHWTAARRAAATPRDLVLDQRGLGYLRRADGSLTAHGHTRAAQPPSLQASTPAGAQPAPAVRPSANGPGGGGGDDRTPPTVSGMDPAAGVTIGVSYGFRATVTDASGVKSVTFVIRTPSGSTQSFAAGQLVGTDVWGVDLTGFTTGSWAWQVVARDNAKRGGNTTTTEWSPFSVDAGDSPPPPSGDCGAATNSQWTCGGAVQSAAGRIYFEMPANKRGTRWNGYVCSGTSVADDTTGRSVILTAAHCVYDDVHKVFARNVLFIPDQAGTTGAGTDQDCSNDPHGCWVPTHGVVDVDWTIRTFPDNIPWDHAYYVVPDAGAHRGTPASSEALDEAVGTLTISIASPVTGATTHALGYSYADDPNFMYCAEGLATESAYGDWWLDACDLSGGSSGGPWVQPMDTASGSGPVVSVNSWGYSTRPGMGGPRLDTAEAACVFANAKTAPATEARGTVVTC